jgi:hypothetical protein
MAREMQLLQQQLSSQSADALVVDCGSSRADHDRLPGALERTKTIQLLGALSSPHRTSRGRMPFSHHSLFPGAQSRHSARARASTPRCPAHCRRPFPVHGRRLPER